MQITFRRQKLPGKYVLESMSYLFCVVKSLKTRATLTNQIAYLEWWRETQVTALHMYTTVYRRLVPTRRVVQCDRANVGTRQAPDAPGDWICQGSFPRVHQSEHYDSCLLFSSVQVCQGPQIEKVIVLSVLNRNVLLVSRVSILRFFVHFLQTLSLSFFPPEPYAHLK